MSEGRAFFGTPKEMHVLKRALLTMGVLSLPTQERYKDTLKR